MTYKPYESRAEHDMINHCSADLAMMSHRLKEIRKTTLETYKSIENIQLNIDGLINSINKYVSRVRESRRNGDKEKEDGSNN
jgi:hypothetical protein